MPRHRQLRGEAGGWRSQRPGRLRRTGRERHAGGNRLAVERRALRQWPATGDAHDIAGVAAVGEKCAHRVGQNTVRQKPAEPRLKLSPAGQPQGDRRRVEVRLQIVWQRPAFGKADERGDVGAHQR
jgi:hypothetical protein